MAVYSKRLNKWFKSDETRKRAHIAINNWERREKLKRLNNKKNKKGTNRKTTQKKFEPYFIKADNINGFSQYLEIDNEKDAKYWEIQKVSGDEWKSVKRVKEIPFDERKEARKLRQEQESEYESMVL